MSNPPGVSYTSNGMKVVPNGFQAVHDIASGMFKGMTTSVSGFTEPYVKKLEKVYSEHRVSVDFGAGAIAVGGLYYAPWWVLSTICRAVPCIYVGYRIGLSSKSSSAAGSEAVTDSGTSSGSSPDDRRALGDSTNFFFGLVANKNSVRDEKTMKIAAQQMKRYTSILERMLEICNRVVIAVNASAQLVEAGGNKSRFTRHLLTSSLREFVAFLATRDDVYDTCISTNSRVNGTRHNYEKLAAMFLEISKRENLNDAEGKRIQCIFINEFLNGLGEPPTKEETRKAIRQLFADGCRDVYLEMQGGATPVTLSAECMLSHEPTRRAGADGRLRHWPKQPVEAHQAIPGV